MPDTPRPTTPAAYWRCPACDTPNPAAPYVTTCLGCGKPRPRSAVGAAADAPFIPSSTPAWGKAVWALSWAYAGVVLAALGLIRWVGDGWWGVTLLLFMPRWAFLAPLAPLAAASGLARGYRHWAVQGATALVVAGPLMAVSLPVASLWSSPPPGLPVRVVTFNMGQSPIDVPAFGRWVSDVGADVVFMQEGRRDDPRLVAFLAHGWHLNRLKSIATRFPIVADLESLPQAYESEERYSSAVDRVRVKTQNGTEFVLVSVHLPTLRLGLQRALRGDAAGLKLHAEWWGREMGRTLSLLARDADSPMIVGGDFNMPDDDATMAALRSSFRFAFEEAGWGYGYTRPANYPWVRIDHLLCGPEWSVSWCRRGPHLGSDHLPLAAEFVLPKGLSPPKAGG